MQAPQVQHPAASSRMPGLVVKSRWELGPLPFRPVYCIHTAWPKLQKKQIPEKSGWLGMEGIHWLLFLFCPLPQVPSLCEGWGRCPLGFPLSELYSTQLVMSLCSCRCAGGSWMRKASSSTCVILYPGCVCVWGGGSWIWCI